MLDKQSVNIRKKISGCVWKSDEFGEPELDCLKIDSKVASDDDKDQFLQILRSGKVEPTWQSKYAQNFRYFSDQIEKLVKTYPSYTALFAARILQNVILLPIEAESQDTALRIFSTLNDRGLPLSDADIFKSQFYSYYDSLGQKVDFIKRWKRLEDETNAIFRDQRTGPMDELFTRYMYYVRACEGIRTTTTAALRIFFEGGNRYQKLKDPQVLTDLEALSAFWRRIAQLDGFSDRTKKLLFVLKYAPNGMWCYLTSVYYLTRYREHQDLDESAFEEFLTRITAFIFAYAVLHPGVNALRTPVYPEMVNLANGGNVSFEKYRFNRAEIHAAMESFDFTNGRPVTRSILTWWAMQRPDQPLLDQSKTFDIEHIYPRRRNLTSPLSNKKNLEALGNKSILEKSVNIQVSDYRFEDKRKYYLGEIGKGTQITDLLMLARENMDFTEDMIEGRTQQIIKGFISFLEENQLLQD